MGKSLAGIALAAGTGTRLRPLTAEMPKPLCPIAGVPLVDRTLAVLAGVGLAGPRSVAVNAHHFADRIVKHLDGRVHFSVEPELLGTGGAIGRLRDWLDGRELVLVNTDSVHGANLASALDGWDHERIRFLAAAEQPPRALDRGLRLVATLMPTAATAALRAEPCSVSERVWLPWEAAGRTEIVAVDVAFHDCGTPGSYLAANLALSGGTTVVGEGATLLGEAEECVIWPGAVVRAEERLRRAIRTTAGRTVLVRAR